MYRFFRVLKNPWLLIAYIARRFCVIFPDKLYLTIQYKALFGKWINWKNPITFNEKLQWLKIYNRKSEYTNMVDKIEVKQIVSSIIGEDYIIPTLGIYDTIEDIDFEQLPNQFVLKCTHDSGGLVVCRDKSKLDIEKAKIKLKHGLNVNYYYQNREWPYFNVKPRIIAEQYMVDESGYELKDYKFFCFDGKVELLFIATDRVSKTEETKFDFFDANFNHLPFTNGHPNSSKFIAKPKGFEEMKEIAAKLSAGHPHLRVDLYNINGKIYFGELTFYHWSGMVPFEPIEWDYKLGEMIKLPIN